MPANKVFGIMLSVCLFLSNKKNVLFKFIFEKISKALLDLQRGDKKNVEIFDAERYVHIYSFSRRKRIDF